VRVLILGSGLAGVTSAYYLRTLGCDVTVVDRAAGAGRETSFANGSMITPSLADPWNSPGVFRALVRSLGREESAILLRAREIPSLFGWGISFLRNSASKHFERNYLRNVGLVHYSQHVMRDLMQIHPLAFDYVDDGTMKIFRDAAAFEHGIKIAHWLKQVGIEHRQLDPAGVVRIEPNLEPVADEIVGGIGYPGDETGNARMFCEEMRRVCSESGVRFRFAESVVEVIRRRKRIEGLRTAKETLTADAYVLAAGSFSSIWSKQLGFDIPVRPAKGYSISVPMHRWEPRPRVPVVDDSLHAALVPVGGVLRVAGTAEFTGYDTSLNPKRIANLVDLFGRVYPKLAERVTDLDVQPWCGLRPLTPDGMPIIGPSPLENLYLNTGHGPLGWSMACGSGKAVADIVTGAPTGMDMTTFALNRF
jgi:D-amino-acid dehydrogenase